MKQRLLLLVALLFCCSTYAQSDFDFTQRWFNESIYNPAAVGNSYTTGVFLHGRAQWVGIDGAPHTQAATFDTYVEHWRSGLGFAVIRDEIGYLSSYTAKLSYSFHVPLSYRSALALGLSGGVLNRNRNIKNSMAFDPNDPALLYKNVSDYAPEFDFGVEYKGPLKVGAAIRHLGVYSNNDLPKPSTNIWAYASSRFNLADQLSVEPAMSYMYHNHVSRYELGAILYFLRTDSRLKYNDRFWLGAMVRFNGQFALLAGVNVTKQMRVGYSVDYGMTNDLVSVSKWGTHEVFVSWQLKRIFYKEALCPAYKKR